MNIFESLINIGKMLSEYVSTLWNWFTNPITIGLDFNQDWLDWLDFSFTFTPIDGLPLIGTTLLLLYLIKKFIPVA